ncbi:hypothetical protein [Mucilaginibacter lappiensis]|uniref:Uncharacterized protein n=1 Tax=Mucilaginibacter lappiensis TaxID=354630 RepID=A0A1N6ZZ70_9SPHI|nr:hypothetical protein [Mucilaginibacter lappiensis]MBB6110375.1 hypothetical protein [Mucilaginibacter lappiensis]MBB6128519.1 hypothetical protein [Mucilaginibacter lappiensis]SIR32140.1 hypothetical protein SAMN05421821_106184 [Mucilaginibacter lappiensis]
MKYLCLLFFIAGSNALYAAGIDRNLLTIGNSYQLNADTDTIVRKKSLSVGVSYGSDALFFGRTGPIKYPFVTGDAIYNTKSGVFIYGSVLKVLGYAPVDEVDVGGGYFYKFSKSFSGAVSYTRFIFNKNANVIKSASSNDINFKNAYDWKLFKTTIILDYLFGKSNDFFTTVSTSKYFETSWSIFDDKDYLSFNPSFNVIVGTQNFVQRYEVDHNYQYVLPPAVLENLNLSAARRNRIFNVLNYSFKVPVAYNRPHYTLEASWRYSMPVNVEGSLENRRESFFNFTFYYLFY